MRARRPVRTVCSSRAAAAACLLIGAAGCAASQPATTPGGAPHGPDGYRNNHIAFEPRGLIDLLKWRVAAWRNGDPKPPKAPIPSVAPDLAFIRANAAAGAAMQPAVTWIGHATVLAQLGGLNVLTDPIFSERASPLDFIGPRRHQPPGVALADLPHIDVVLISHNHYDHLDTRSVQQLNAQPGGAPLFIVPLGLKSWLADHGISHAVELDWWQAHVVSLPDGASAEAVLTPVQHWSGRGLTDRMDTLWGGFAVFTPGFNLFHAGDTGYSPDFVDIRRRFADRQPGGDFDLALLPIGAYEPRWFMAQQHVNPAEAVRIHTDLHARHSLGIHWGTFQLTDEPLDEPPERLAAARRAAGLADDAFFTLAVGETRRLAPRSR